jgi:hypothetical protein
MHRLTTLLLPPLLAVLFLLNDVGPAAAACSPNANFFAWNRCWSGTRLGLWFVGLVLAWVFVFHLWPFPSMISAKNRKAPWPREALGAALAWWWVVVALLFLTLFAFVSTELRITVFQFGTSPALVLATEWFLPAVLIGVAVLIWLALPRLIRHG